MIARPPALTSLLRQHPSWYESVAADVDYATTLLDRIVGEELAAVMAQTAAAITTGNDGLHRTAHTLAYDAARKAVDAVLLSMGLRVSRDGGHVATVEAAIALFEPPPASRERNTDAFRRSRRVRHEDEYPRQSARPPLTVRERRPLTQSCIRLVNDCRESLELDTRDDLVPTDAKVLLWRQHELGR